MADLLSLSHLFSGLLSLMVSFAPRAMVMGRPHFLLALQCLSRLKRMGIE
jgi:hypothetical protein